MGILVVKLEQMARAMFLSKVCKNCTMVGDTLRPWLKMVFGRWRRVANIFGPLDEAGQVGLGMNVLTCNTNQRSVHHSECEQHTNTEWYAWQRGVADAVRCTHAGQVGARVVRVHQTGVTQCGGTYVDTCWACGTGAHVVRVVTRDGRHTRVVTDDQ
jgi:hypothetical protein